MSPPRVVLYIDHSGKLGGAPTSLRYLAEGLPRHAYRPVIAMIKKAPEVRAFYESRGIEVVHIPGVRTFEHTTACWATLKNPRSVVQLLLSFALLWRTAARIRGSVRRIAPDLIHLNSVVLSPVALALRRHQGPVVWHIRESPVAGRFGLRRAWIRRILHTTRAELIFISNDDRAQWVGNRRGRVIYNFANPAEPGPTAIGDGIPSILFLGGYAEIKGTHVLIEALGLLKRRSVAFKCAIAGIAKAEAPPAKRRWPADLLTPRREAEYERRIEQRISELRLREELQLLPFVPDVGKLLRQASVLVFPSVRPHFARPVVEAAYHGVPAVASAIGGVSELIEDGKTGILVPVEDPARLAEALGRLLGDADLCRALGSRARERASRIFDRGRLLASITAVYDASVGTS